MRRIRRLLRHARRHGGRRSPSRTPTTGSVAAPDAAAVISYSRGSGATAEILPSWDGPSVSVRTPTPSSASRRRFFGVAPGVAPEVTIPAHQQRQAVVAAVGDLELGPPDRPPARGVTLAEANTALRQFWPAVLEIAAGGKVPANRRDSFLGRQTSLESAHAGFSRVRNRFAKPCGSFWPGRAAARGCDGERGQPAPRTRAAQRREIAVRLAIGAGRAGWSGRC